jgi:hypothetical protein
MIYLLIIAGSTLLFYLIRNISHGSTSTANTAKFNNVIEKEIPMLLTPKEFALKYASSGGRVKGGALCFWGHWFGKPHDNFHQITSVNFDSFNNILTISFSEQEILTVFNPTEIAEYNSSIQIDTADKIHWQWYYYGRSQEAENLFYYDIKRIGNSISGATNANRYKPNWNELTISKPAVWLT